MSPDRSTVAVDVALVGTVLIWAVNFSVVKMAVALMPPMAFNTLRLVGASAILLAIAKLIPAPTITSADRLRLVAIAMVGHTGYQLFFIHSVHRTTASNAAILLGLTPVFVAVLSTLFAGEKSSARVWTGILVSVAGVYLVLRESENLGGDAVGDWLALGATLCWSIYTVAGGPLLARYGLFKTNAYSIAIGTAFFLPFAAPALSSVAPRDVPGAALGAAAFSLVFALVVAYCCWYYAVSRIGPTQTAVYANLTPVAAVAVAHLWLGEPVSAMQIVGAATILFGIYLVRGTQSPSLDSAPRSR